MKPNIPKQNKVAKNYVIKSENGKYFNGMLSLHDQDKNWTNNIKEARKLTRETAQRKIDLYKHFFQDCVVFKIN